jgi:hypothetical protein
MLKRNPSKYYAQFDQQSDVVVESLLHVICLLESIAQEFEMMHT